VVKLGEGRQISRGRQADLIKTTETTECEGVRHA